MVKGKGARAPLNKASIMHKKEFNKWSKLLKITEELEALNIKYYLVKIVREYEGVYYVCSDSPSIFGGAETFYRSKYKAIESYIKKNTTGV